MKIQIKRIGKEIVYSLKKGDINFYSIPKELISIKSIMIFVKSCRINLKFAKNIFFYSLPEDPSIFKELVEMIKPSHYKNSLEKYKIEDKNLLANNYSAVISLVSKLEKYNLEKIVGTKIFDYIIKKNLENYVC